MNGYQLLIDSYNMLLQDENTEEYDKPGIRQHIAALEIVKNKTEAEIDFLFNTGAFNEICINYCIAALKHCDISAEKCAEIQEELRKLFDTRSAEQMRKNHEEIQSAALESN